MNVLGLDYGEKHIGVAFSEGIFAQALTSFSTKEATLRIKKLCQERRVDLIVIGLPEGRLSKKVKQYGQALVSQLKIPVQYIDETLTSQSSSKLLYNYTSKKRRDKEHSVAAALILQSFIDKKNDYGAR